MVEAERMEELEVPTMICWTDRVYYSVAHDDIVSRVSGFDENSQEHYMIVQGGKGYRDRRNEALLQIQDSIEAGEPAGEVICR